MSSQRRTPHQGRRGRGQGVEAHGGREGREPAVVEAEVSRMSAE